MDFLAKLEKQSRPFRILLGFVIIGAIGLSDFLTGYEFSFSLFYVIPITLITWFLGQRLGIMASLTSALIWFGADTATGHPYSHPLLPIWNSLIRLSFFVIITLLLSTVRNAMEREKELARTDSLTGAMNSRLFYELAQMEIDRLRRYEHPFTVAYIDLDNFKTVNDQFGHPTGDQVLRTVVCYTKSLLRKTDVIARLGGDEFALLLPETNRESARVAISKLHSSLLEEMQKSNWPITFSIGVLTCNVAPHTADELVRKTDELMYSAKHDTKNTIKYSTYTG
ncbi:MAG TPA: diguanylate cyclase [Anaerolineae bacterium]|nr:diguanylate cyclase [Anaerolineae bacterium]